MHFTLALARNVITPAEETVTYAVPKQLGYFKQENLNVSYLLTDGSTAVIQAVASGSADAGYASSMNIAAAVDKGVPVKAFAGSTIKWPYYTAVREGSDIKTIADLKGKRIGVISIASASYTDLKANLKLAGLSENDVTIIAVGAGARAAAAIMSNQVDAVNSFAENFEIMAQNGVSLRKLPRPDSIEKLFSVTLVAREDTIKNNPEKLVAFARSAFKGMIYADRYFDSALRLSFKEFPELPGSSDPSGEAAQKTARIMKIALYEHIPDDGSDPSTWGRWQDIPRDRWQAIIQFAFDAGQITKKLDVEQIWDNSLIPQIYNFDVNDIIIKKQ